MPTPKILLYGNSILIERLASRLKMVSSWNVERRESGEVRNLDEVHLIVVDLCDVTTSAALPMLCALPGVMLVGMDAIANTLTILTGRQHLSDSMPPILDTLKKAM